MEIEYDIFISFKNSNKDGTTTQDRALAYRLYIFLKSKDLKVFFSEATLEKLGADSWGDEIEKALRTSKVFIALSTKEKHFYSYWLQKERTTFLTLKSLDKSKALYSYIASPLTTNNLPEDIKGFECFENSKEDEFERLYSFISNHFSRYFHHLNEDEFIDDLSANPYKGLQSFSYEDRDNYYGRKSEAKIIAKRVKNTRLFTLLGASGSGKSSLIFAGIKPLIEEKGRKILSFRPLDNPFKNLASLFIPMLYSDKLEQIRREKELANDLINNTITTTQLVEKFLEKEKVNHLYMIIDQFEELFTLTSDRELRDVFISRLVELIEGNSPITIILSMRADFLIHLSYYDALNQAYNSYPNSMLSILTHERLKEVIEKPALAFGVQFQEGLVDKIIDEIEKEAGQLPLLEFALYQLWLYKKGRIISFETLEQIGSISRSISHYAESIYDKYPDISNSIKRIFINLVTIGRGTKDTKKVAKIEEFNQEDRDTILLLANERLIVTKKEEIEIVHEALIQEWKALQLWIDEYRDFLQWQERVRFDRVFYEQKGDLLTDSKLLVAKDFFGTHKEYISILDKKFIEKSIAKDKRKREKRWLLIGFIFFSLVGTIFFVLDLKRKSDKKTELLSSLTKITINSLIKTDIKLITKEMKSISYAGKKEIFIEIISELLKENLAINDKEKAYWQLKLTVMREDEIINLLGRLIVEPIQLAKLKKAGEELNKNKVVQKTFSFAYPYLLTKNLKSYGISTISLKGKKSYKENEHLEFWIDTMGKVGYLYILFKNKKNTLLVYPNSKSPLSELMGKHKFPDDFGESNMIIPKKNNRDEKEEITIYSILTKKPVRDIHELTGEQLDNLIGVFSMKSKEVDERKINMYVGRMEFDIE